MLFVTLAGLGVISLTVVATLCLKVLFAIVAELYLVTVDKLGVIS